MLSAWSLLSNSSLGLKPASALNLCSASIAQISAFRSTPSNHAATTPSSLPSGSPAPLFMSSNPLTNKSNGFSLCLPDRPAIWSSSTIFWYKPATPAFRPLVASFASSSLTSPRLCFNNSVFSSSEIAVASPWAWSEAYSVNLSSISAQVKGLASFSTGPGFSSATLVFSSAAFSTASLFPTNLSTNPLIPSVTPPSLTNSSNTSSTAKPPATKVEIVRTVSGFSSPLSFASSIFGSSSTGAFISTPACGLYPRLYSVTGTPVKSVTLCLASCSRVSSAISPGTSP